MSIHATQRLQQRHERLVAVVGPGILGVACLVALVSPQGPHVSRVRLHSVAVREVARTALLSASGGGRLLMWGANDSGQLGTGGYAWSNHPIVPRGLGRATIIRACAGYAMAVDARGAVWYWGGDDFLVPQHQAELTNVVTIALEAGEAIALERDGTLWHWVLPFAGAPGSAPQRVALPEAVRAIAAGCKDRFPSFVAETRAGTVWMWGDHGNTRLQQVPGLQQVVDLASGDGQHLAVTSDGALWAWGSNDGRGSLGLGPTVPEAGYTLPQRIDNIPPMAAVFASSDHSAAIDCSGRLWQWGRVMDTLVDRSQLAPQLDHVTALALGDNHTLALRSDGTMWAWGLNDKGQLGTPTIGGQSAVPIPIAHLAHVVAVAAGDAHSAALQALPPVSKTTTTAGPAGIHRSY